MERDFMGLNSRESSVAIKEEIVEDGKDSAHTKTSGVPFFKTYFPAAGLNYWDASVKQQFLGGVPHISHHSILPSRVPVTGTTEKWVDSKTSSTPAQMIIFYAGTVNVFDGISLEKAQAIMLLAGNGGVLSNMSQPKLHVQEPNLKPAVAHRGLINQTMNKPPSSLSSPMSVSSRPIEQSGGASVNINDVKISNTVGSTSTTTLDSKVETPKMAASPGSVSASAMISSAVPQARKASLARFLERRRERVMNSAPYCASKKAGNQESDGTSGAGSSSVSTSDDLSVNL